ncbi:MAG: ABC transporter ATP-binding protein [Candidatus Thermoplasmatota archaeon]|nr:ABC transporter ATP-binding protein [Candidatus Thermoplasmatota archaeon]MCL5793483.1 ABC transporter ATP-binding protein [Candidatus Thermoplasmatota archaeon]
MIEANGLKKIYRNGFQALKGIDLSLSDRVTSITGRNGAGKTTLVRILSTQLTLTSGKATINGFDVMQEARKIRKFIVSIPQEAAPVGIMTPAEMIKLYLVGRGLSLHDADTDARQAMEELDIISFRNTPTDMLSGGTKRKVFVAMAIAANADLVFLDEPTTGLDPIFRMEVWSAIRKLKGNIVLTTHYMEEARELSDLVVLIEGGRVLERGTVGELMKRFKGKVRVEGSRITDPDLTIGGISIKYVGMESAQKYVESGNMVRQVSLDDLFILHGVEIEP